jgi:phage terminase small subunit
LKNTLSHKQKAFLNEFIIDHNATQAAIRAGYSERSAEVTGFRLLRNDKICEGIHKQEVDLAKELRQKFIGDAIKAREVMLQVLNDPNSSNRDKITVAKDLLDRAGFGPIDKKELRSPNSNAIEIVFVDPEK